MASKWFRERECSGDESCPGSAIHVVALHDDLAQGPRIDRPDAEFLNLLDDSSLVTSVGT